MSIFKLKGPPKQPETIEYDTENISEFKYFPNVHTEFVENKDGAECVCCGKISKYVYKNAAELTDKSGIVLCSDCIANGKASRKLKLEFNSKYCVAPWCDKNAQNEVIYKTPSVFSSQEFLWPTCCDDFCAYMGNLADKWHDVSKIYDEIDSSIIDAIKRNETFVEIGRPIEELIEACNQNSVGVLVFKCLRCGKCRVLIDLD